MIDLELTKTHRLSGEIEKLRNSSQCDAVRYFHHNITNIVQRILHKASGVIFAEAYYVTHTLYGITVDRGGVPNIVASECMIDFFFFFNDDHGFYLLTVIGYEEFRCNYQTK